MTKKYRLDLGSIIDNETGHILSDVQVRNLLNKYHEEKKQLKRKYGKQQEEIEILSEENQRFKFILNESIRTERTELGKSVLKQLKRHLKYDLDY